MNPNASNNRRSRQSSRHHDAFSNHLNALLMNDTTMLRRPTSTTSTATGSQLHTHDDNVTSGSSFNSMLPLLSYSIGDAVRVPTSDSKGVPPASKSVIEKLPRVMVVSSSSSSSKTGTSSPSPVGSDDAECDGVTVPVTKVNLECIPPCSICTDEFDDDDDDITHLPCMHYFHRRCVTQWLSRNCSCPVCRKEMPTDDQEYEDMRRVKRREAAASQMRSFMFN